MIILKLGTPNNYYTNNHLNRNKYNFSFLFIFSFLNYFTNNLENIYFLILSLFQVSTSEFINIIPQHYSQLVLGQLLYH